MNILWFVKYQHKTSSSQIVVNFTLPEGQSEHDAMLHGWSFIVSEFHDNYRCVEATPICRTEDTVYMFEPC